MTCALTWGVTYVGNYHYWALLTLSRDHHFRYRECIEGRRSLKAAFRRKPDCGFGIYFVKTCIRTLNFNICLVKSNVLTLDLLLYIFCEY